MKIYAQLNENNICIGLSILKDEVSQSSMIEIQEINEDLLWRKYENGVWSQEKYLPDFAQIELNRIEKLEQENNQLKTQITWLNEDMISLIEMMA